LNWYKTILREKEREEEEEEEEEEVKCSILSLSYYNISALQKTVTQISKANKSILHPMVI
jgi:hypothetical protein